VTGTFLIPAKDTVPAALFAWTPVAVIETVLVNVTVPIAEFDWTPVRVVATTGMTVPAAETA
jgi:hypothetical protein